LLVGGTRNGNFGQGTINTGAGDQWLPGGGIFSVWPICSFCGSAMLL